MTKALEKAQARVDRMKAQLRKLRAEKRRQDKAARLKADAHLGAIVRAQHPELAKILLASIKQHPAQAQH